MMTPKEQNNEIAWMVCDYLNDRPCAITKELMCQVDPDENVPVERLYAALLSSFCGAETEEQMWYFSQMVRRCEVKEYLENPYFKYVCFPQLKVGRWELTRCTFRGISLRRYKGLRGRKGSATARISRGAVQFSCHQRRRKRVDGLEAK